MPRNSAGTYSLPASDVNPPISNTTIDPVAFAAQNADIGSELTNSVDRLGRGAMQAPLAMGGNNITNAGAPVAQADVARLADIASYLPPGTILEYGASTAPAGWLECNGAAVSRTTYAVLFAVIGTVHGAGDGSTTFNVPDKRGYFTRGWDHGAGIDPSRVFASTQVDGFASHTHIQNAHAHGITDPGHAHTYQTPVGSNAFQGGGSFAINAGSPASTNGAFTGITINNATATNQTTGGTETVPKNKAGFFIIRT
jgi:microcystin-dependent protein